MPLNVLEKYISKRNPKDLTPIDFPAPTEVQCLMKELNNLFKRLSDMLAKERRFIADAAHELRTPLTALKLQIEVAQMCEDQSSRDKCLDKVILAVDRATRLVEQLLTMSRLDHLSEVPDLSRFDVVELSRKLITELRRENSKLIQISLEEPPLVVEGSPGFLEILLRNLIGNALKYTPSYSKIWMEFDSHSFTVCDNGNGVPTEWLNRLTERFSRPEGQMQIGSGLGLSIVQSITKLHNFDLKLFNSLEGGFRSQVIVRK